jgi:AcrR family transcriptional regulator
MGNTDGNKTKHLILKTAEKLFSNEGFDGASVGRIAKEAGVNKAAIYYHFKNKKDILMELFNTLSKRALDIVSASCDSVHDSEHSPEIFDKEMKGMLEFLEKHKKIVNIMFMESLKESNKDQSLFKCADIMINDEIKGILNMRENAHENKDLSRKELQVYEFFTGFMPIITFAVFNKKYSEYFDFDKEKLTKTFLRAFRETHLASEFVGKIKKKK